MDESTDEGHLFKTIQYAVAWYERKKIAKRASNGKVNRIKSGYRPFPQPPVGYTRVRSWPKNYNDEIDQSKWPLIQEWLELFASNVIQTQADLRRFRDKKWLRTNRAWSTTLQRTFPEKVLQLHRLFYYAWYIFYPDRWINEPIEWKHIWLISLPTAYSIVKKLQKVHKSHNRKQSSLQKMTDENPLRWAVMCPHCKRKFTSRNTTKYRMKDWEKIKKIYPYYGCANPNCADKVYIPKKKLEGDFEDLLADISLPFEFKNVIEIIFKQNREQSKKNQWQAKANKKKQVESLKKKQEQIEQTMLRTTNPKLSQKLEKERSSLDGEIEKINDSTLLESESKERMQTLLTQTQSLFENPVSLWEKGSSNMRQLLIRVRFWDHLTYAKNEGLRTTDNAVLYMAILCFNQSISVNRDTRSIPRTELSQKVNQLTSILQERTALINALREQIVFEWLWKEEHNKCVLLLEPP